MSTARCCSLLLLGLAWSLLGCQAEPEVASVLRIGFTSEASLEEGEGALLAARLQVAQIQAAGGIDRRGVKWPLELVVAETGNTPEGSVRAALELINQRHVVALVGPSASSNAIPVAELAEKAGIPMISPGSTHPETTAGRPHVFRVASTDPFQGGVLARFTFDDLGVRRGAVFYEVTSPHSRRISTEFVRVFEELGGTVPAIETYTSADRDHRMALRRLLESQPEVLFLPNSNTHVRRQTQQLRELDDQIVVLGSDVWSPRGLMGHASARGAYASQHWHLDLQERNPRARQFVDAFRRRHEMTPTGMAPMVYDAVGLMAKAIGEASTTEPTAIRDALARIEGYQGATGELSFRGTDGDPQRWMVMTQIQENDVVLHRVIDNMTASVP